MHTYAFLAYAAACTTDMTATNISRHISFASPALAPGVGSLPDSWHHFDDTVAFDRVFLRSCRTRSTIPHCIRCSFSKILTQVLAERDRTHSLLDLTDAAMPAGETACIRAWKLLLLLRNGCYCTAEALLVLMRRRRGYCSTALVCDSRR